MSANVIITVFAVMQATVCVAAAINWIEISRLRRYIEHKERLSESQEKEGNED